MSLPLNDADIRQALIAKLRSHPRKPRAIMEELRVHNGNAIADLVALYSEAHCYEIKGSSDKISRLLTQGAYYNLSFRKITLVTTENHKRQAEATIPSFWGIVIAKNDGCRVSFYHARRSQINPEFNKKLAALTLWKSEMLQLLKDERHKQKSRDFLAQLISESKKKLELSNNICEILHSRHIRLEEFTDKHLNPLS